LAKELIAEGAPILTQLAGESDLVTREIQVRWPSHEAKVLLAEYRNTEAASRTEEPYLQAKSLYEKSAGLAAELDHLRVNILIEAADQLVEVASEVKPAALRDAVRTLEVAHRGLDAHQCDACVGYFYYVSARANALRGRFSKAFERDEARLALNKSLQDAKICREYYEKVAFGGLAEIDQVERETKLELELMNRPTRIFISHSGKDKVLVRRFKRMLSALGFDTWLDEEAMPAGAKLERSLLKGFEESCAVVFFITPNFRDRRYIEAEIDYAISQKRKRGERFAIVSLIFPVGRRRPPKVPAPLQPYVWKQPKDDLEALECILTALPIKLPLPQWPPR